MRSNESGIIDTVMLTTNKDGHKYCKVPTLTLSSALSALFAGDSPLYPPYP